MFYIVKADGRYLFHGEWYNDRMQIFDACYLAVQAFNELEIDIQRISTIRGL